MQVVINGEPHEVRDCVTVTELLTALGLPADRLALELDGAILKRSDWSSRVLQPGARLEIVHFVGGG